MVCAGAVVQPGARIGCTSSSIPASIGHDCRVGDYAHVAVAHLGGGASIAEGVFMGLGSVVLPSVHVGAWATVGAGAVVTRNVDPETTVIGIPARPLAVRGARDSATGVP